MVRFDSQTHCLLLQKATTVAGQGFKSDPIVLNLDLLDENSRQVAIAVAKLVVNFSNGGQLDKSRLVKTKDGEQDRSPIDEFNILVNRLFPKEPPKDDQPQETGEGQPVE